MSEQQAPQGDMNWGGIAGLLLPVLGSLFPRGSTGSRIAQGISGALAGYGQMQQQQAQQQAAMAKSVEEKRRYAQEFGLKRGVGERADAKVKKDAADAARQREYWARRAAQLSVQPYAPSQPATGGAAAAPSQQLPGEALAPAPTPGYNPGTNAVVPLEAGSAQPASNGQPAIFDPNMSPEARAMAEEYQKGGRVKGGAVTPQPSGDMRFSPDSPEYRAQRDKLFALNNNGQLGSTSEKRVPLSPKSMTVGGAAAQPPTPKGIVKPTTKANHKLAMSQQRAVERAKARAAGVNLSEAALTDLARMKVGAEPEPVKKPNQLLSVMEQMADNRATELDWRSKQIGKENAKVYTALVESAGVAAEAGMAKYEELDRLGISLAKQPTGALFEGRTKAANVAMGLANAGLLPEGARDKFLEVLNVNSSDVEVAQATSAALKQMLTGLIGNSGDGEGGMPANNFSNKDLQFLIDSLPSLGNTQEGNALILDVMKLQAQRGVFKYEWLNAQIDARDAQQWKATHEKSPDNPPLRDLTAKDLRSSWIKYIASPEGRETLTTKERGAGGRTFEEILTLVRTQADKEAALENRPREDFNRTSPYTDSLTKAFGS